MNQVTPPSGVKGSAPVSPAPKSNVAVEPGEQFYERALRRRIRSWPDVSAAGFLTVELSQYLKGTGGATAEAVMAALLRLGHDGLVANGKRPASNRSQIAVVVLLLAGGDVNGGKPVDVLERLIDFRFAVEHLAQISEVNDLSGHFNAVNRMPPVLLIPCKEAVRDDPEPDGRKFPLHLQRIDAGYGAEGGMRWVHDAKKFA